MKRYLLLYAVCATALIIHGYRRHRTEISRLGQNQEALAAEVEHYRNRLGEASASAQVLRLRCSEFEELRAADATRIRRLGIRLRRLEAAAKTAAVTEVGFGAPLTDTVPPCAQDSGLRNLPTAGPDLRPLFPSPALTLPALALRPYAASGRTCASSPRAFRWRDPWVTVEGIVTSDSVHCRVQSVDTLRQIVHRVPRRFLFFRWGTKAIRQEISSSNPHTRIVWTEYVRIER